MSTTYTPPPAKPLAPSFSLPYVVAIVPYLQNAEAAYHKQWGSPVLAQYKSPLEQEIHLSGLRAAEVLSTQLIDVTPPWVWPGQGVPLRPVY